MTTENKRPGGAREKLAAAADSARSELLASRTAEENRQAQELQGIGRLEEIRKRIAEKYYSSPEILDRIADNLTEDM